jgi:hypothetical protein
MKVLKVPTVRLLVMQACRDSGAHSLFILNVPCLHSPGSVFVLRIVDLDLNAQYCMRLFSRTPKSFDLHYE